MQANKGQQLSGLKKEKGREYLIVLLALQIKTALQMVPSHPTTPDAITGMAKMIMDEFWMLKLDEIMFAFKRGVTGYYGKIYGLLSLNVFCDWIRAYIAEGATDHSDITAEREKENHNKKFDGAKQAEEIFGNLVGTEGFEKPNPEVRTGQVVSIAEFFKSEKQREQEAFEMQEFLRLCEEKKAAEEKIWREEMAKKAKMKPVKQ